MEYEVRYYFSEEKVKEVIKRIEDLGLKKSLRTYEKTSQYNHSDKRFDFYSLEIDGRFRIRVSKNDEMNKCISLVLQVSVNTQTPKRLHTSTWAV